MKDCKNKNCNQFNPQPLEAFSINRALPDGRSVYCKVCCAIRSRKHRKQIKFLLEHTKVRIAHWGVGV